MFCQNDNENIMMGPNTITPMNEFQLTSNSKDFLCDHNAFTIVSEANFLFSLKICSEILSGVLVFQCVIQEHFHQNAHCHCLSFKPITFDSTAYTNFQRRSFYFETILQKLSFQTSSER